MPIGIITQTDYEKEIVGNANGNGKIPARSVIIEQDKSKGRGNKPEVPEEIRNVIAQEGMLGASSKDVAREFNVSPQSVNSYKNGSTSLATYNTPDKRKGIQ